VSKKSNGPGDELPVVTPDAGGAVAEAEAVEPGPEAVTGLAESPPADETEALRRERDELKEALLRRRADFENYRRRVERDRGAATAEAEAGILRQVVGTVDNLERALAASGADSTLRQGVDLTHRELVALLDSLGVVAIAPLGERFDPALHQAILHEPVTGIAEGTVAEVYRKGYTYKDRLLRPALVKVASGGAEPAAAGGDLQ